ncbi:hypothetical protein D3C85_431650 [compost metagenome]
MHAEGFGDQHGADHDQERQCEHLQARVLVDKVADGASREHHHDHRDDNGRNHHRHVVDQADRGDHRVQREDDVDDGDLHDDAHEAIGLAARTLRLLFAFQAVIDLRRALEQQEQAAEEQDQVASGKALAEDLEQVGGQAHHPADRQQQQDPRAHGQGQAEEARLRLLGLGQATDEDRDKDDVVDAEDDFQCGQGQKRDPEFRAGQPFHRD